MENSPRMAAIRVWIRKFVAALLRCQLCGANDSYLHRKLSSLERLPTEVILIILDFCSPETGIALSLTSKRLYGQFFAHTVRNHALKTHVKLRLLRLLEKDLPQLFTCSTCVRLYHWERCALLLDSYGCPLRQWSSRKPEHTDRARLGGGYRRPDYLNTELRDLIIRASRRGPLFGPPVECLANDFIADRGNGFKSYKTFVPRVVENSLMLWTTVAIKIHLDANLHHQTRCLQNCTCSHTGTRMSTIIKCALSHLSDEQRLVEQGTEANISTPKCLQLLKCKCCATDIQIEVLCQGERAIGLQIHSWRDFGNAETGTETLQGAHFARDKPQKRSIWNADRPLHEFFEPDYRPVQRKVSFMSGKSGTSFCAWSRCYPDRYFLTAED